jgi:hypothetical protein
LKHPAGLHPDAVGFEKIKDPRRKRRRISEESPLAVLVSLLIVLASLLDVVADHGLDLRRKRRGMHPKGFNFSFTDRLAPGPGGPSHRVVHAAAERRGWRDVVLEGLSGARAVT